jgi:hypothetical protein
MAKKTPPPIPELESVSVKKKESKLKNWDTIIVKLFIACILCLALFEGCSWVNHRINQKDEWVGEEFLETVIESKLGLPEGSIDLTPSTPEK